MMKKGRAIAMLACLLVFGCMAGKVAMAQETAPAEILDNTLCPVLTDEAVDPEVFVEYQGKRVYLCCRRCQRMFQAEPEKYLANLPQFAGVALSSAVTTAAQPEEPEAHHEHAERPFLPRLLEFVGKLHVVVVHFPIALLLAAALAELGVMLGYGGLSGATRFCLVLGAAGAVVAAGLGWIDASFEESSARLAQALFIHRWLGVSTAVLAVVALALYERARPAPGSTLHKWARAALFVAAGLVGLAGHFGGTLVHGLSFYTF